MWLRRCAAAFVLCALPGVCLAADGDIDPTWAGGGIRSLRLGPSSQQFTAAARRGNGHVLAVGTASSGAASDVVLADLDASGHSDPTFGDGGIRVMSVSAASVDRPSAVLIDGSGAIVVGEVSGAEQFGFLLRITATGATDTAFAESGIARFAPREVLGVRFNAAAWTADRRIVVVGSGAVDDGSGAPPARVLVARFLGDGSLDRSFGGGAGYRVIDTGSAYRGGTANGVAILPDGSAIVVGYVGDGGYADAWLVLRVDRNGNVTPSFGTGGQVLEAFDPNSPSRANAVVARDDGRFAVLGQSGNPEIGGPWRLVQYAADGTRDVAFGNGGLGEPSASVGSLFGLARSLAILPDGGYAAVGQAYPSIGVLRYRADGSRDSAFGNQGAAAGPRFAAYEQSIANAVVPDSTGGFAVFGGVGLTLQDLVSLRFDGAGNVDSLYADHGVARVALFNGSNAPLDAILPLADGRTLVGSAGVARLAMLTPDGGVDTTFGNEHGVQSLLGSDASGQSVQYLRLARQHTGRFIVAYPTFLTEPPLQRRMPDGSIDPSFHAPLDRNALFGPSYWPQDGVESIAVDASDRIVLGGMACDSTACDATTAFQFARLLPDGALDTTFGNAGHIDHAFGPTGTTESVRAIAMQADGKIVAAGTYQDNATALRRRLPAVMRLLADGQLDTGFGTNGVATIDVPSDFGADITNLALMADGRIVLGGVALSNAFANGQVAMRLLANGTPDPTFHGSGPGISVTSKLAGTLDRGAMLVDDVGRVWFSGPGDVVRFAPDGSIDPFPTGDGHAQRWPKTTFYPRAVGLGADGRVIAVGSTWTKAGSVAIRYQAGGPGLKVTPDNIDFLTSRQGVATQPRSVTLRATGTGSIGLASPTASPGFSLSNHCPSSLVAGATCTIDVRFTAAALDTMTAGALIVPTDGKVLDPSVALAGRAARVEVALFGSTTQSTRLGQPFQPFSLWIQDASTHVPITGQLNIAGPALGAHADLTWATTTGTAISVQTNTISPSTISATAVGSGGTYKIIASVPDTDASATLEFSNVSDRAQLPLDDGSTVVASVPADDPGCVIEAMRLSSTYADVPQGVLVRGGPFEVTLGSSCPPSVALRLSDGTKAASDSLVLLRQRGPAGVWDPIDTSGGINLPLADGDVHDLDARPGTITVVLAAVAVAPVEVPVLSPIALAALCLLLAFAGSVVAPGNRRRKSP